MSNFLNDLWEKTKNTGKATIQIATLPAGLAMDVARQLPGTEALDDGPAGFFTGKGAADFLIGEGTLTGWSVNRAGEGLDWTYRNAIENPIETTWLKFSSWASHDSWSPNAGISWAEAWERSRERSLGQTLQLVGNEMAETVRDGTGLNTQDAIGSIPFVGAYLSGAGIGVEENSDIVAADRDAWAEFQEYSPFWSGALATTTDLSAQVALDPFLLAAKPLGALRQARNQRPVREGEENNLAELMATEDRGEVPVFGMTFSQRRAGLRSRTDPLIGTTKSETVFEDGVAVFDEAGNPVERVVTDRAGWLDGKSATQVYAGLNLRTHAYGTEIATLLSRTNQIADAGARVDTRRDILAAMGGDPTAMGRLAERAETEEFSYVLSNAMRARGDGSLQVAITDEMNAAAIARGEALPAYSDPAVVAGIEREITSAEGYSTWLYGAMKDRTFRVSPGGQRALARLDRRGLGRDGTLNTGFERVDNFVNDRMLGRWRSNGSPVDEALAASDELNPAPLADDALANGRVYQPERSVRFTSSNGTPAIAIRSGLKTAGWVAGGWIPKAGAAVSDALRGRVTHGSLNVEDPHLSVAVAQDMARRAGLAPERVQALTDGVIAAETAPARAIAVARAQDEAMAAIAERYGVDKDTLAAISQDHSKRAEAVAAAMRGQSYSGHVRVGDDGRPTRGDVMMLPDEGGTVVAPILNTQTANHMLLMDLDYVEAWLKRDNVLASVSAVLRNGRNPNPLVARANEAGFNSKVTSTWKGTSDRLVRVGAERSNTWWKRSVLLLRAPSYAARNSIEEELRVMAVGRTAAVTDEAVAQAYHDARDFARRRGWTKDQVNESLPAFTELNLARTRLADLTEDASDPDLAAEVATIKAELKRLRSQRERQLKDGGDVAQVDARIAYLESRPALLEQAQWSEEAAALRAQVESLEAALKDPQFSGQGTRTLPGFGDTQFPNAFEGSRGAIYRELSKTSQFDNDVTGFADGTYARFRGLGEAVDIDVSVAGTPQDVIDRHGEAWSWILNKQIAQDAAGRVVLRGMADELEPDEIVARVQRFLKSDEGRDYRNGNIVRHHDPDAWAEEITDMVMHYAPTSNLSRNLLEREVGFDELQAAFPDHTVRPRAHPAGVDSLIGVKAGRIDRWSAHAFQWIDKMSVQRMTRHPMFKVHFEAEQTRLAGDYLRKAQLERGDDAMISLDEINDITEQARRSAALNVRRTFYDTTSRSHAAEKMKYLYPFFAAHQDSMSFWGRAIAQRPEVLRGLQIAFNQPYALGLVVDQDGNVVEPGEGILESDHRVLLQVPAAWGGPDPEDPTQQGTGWSVNINSANLITQNGSILNPGAGPLAAIPAAYIATKFGSSDERIGGMMRWFNAFGAPNTGDNPLLPEALQALDQAIPTPIKRLGTLFDAYSQKHSREFVDMWSIKFQEAQVEFHEKYDRPPNSQEAAELEREVDEVVKSMALLRAFSSILSPVQPRPQSKFEGFIKEYQRLADEGRNSGQGWAWATDKFLDRYGEEYIYLTRSSSEYRANIDPTTATVRALKAYEDLTEDTPPEVWQAIVGGEGEGAFSIDAYRWMQQKDIALTQGGGKLIDRKSVRDAMFSTAVSAGYREYNKAMDLLQSIATQNGLVSPNDHPELRRLRAEVIDELSERFPQWAENRIGKRDYESTILPGLRKVAADRRLSRDPARGDIRALNDYLFYRGVIVDELQKRVDAGEPGSITAQANADILTLFVGMVDELSESNTHFANYHVPGLIDRDPLYRPDLIGETTR
ncbi:hypothetical protein HMPREF0063_11494 [Aeromicrobium marinum DSM 15272]|uniref:Large polyvalent protein associated domain-containing protein n=1 Tax=Aeromicrobium marinum DSM 15272 TaxID=585531 RepID=E2SBT5_9ACTN|nr:hypothetical protein [Aeromicrobium marinum]EFQ83221.1 hypothetical protein HMPREF0063_11494 [Aeromicrobium marinum DSM 15272]